MTEERARRLLENAGVFFEDPEMKQTINLNDSLTWATADGEFVPDEELPELGRLFFEYGWGGILFWSCKKRGEIGCIRSEFPLYNRYIEFVANEERIRNKHQSSKSKHVYAKHQYTIGLDDE